MLLYQIDKPDIARYNCKRVRRTRVLFCELFSFYYVFTFTNRPVYTIHFVDIFDSIQFKQVDIRIFCPVHMTFTTIIIIIKIMFDCFRLKGSIPVLSLTFNHYMNAKLQ